MATERWFVVTRYVRDDGRIIRHIYAPPEGHWTTRARAQTAAKRQIKEDRQHYGDAFVDQEIAAGKFEIVPVRVVEEPSE